MSKYASRVVEQARAWIGKKESDGSHREIIDVYNSHKPLARGYAVKYTDAWCSTFVSAVSIKLGYTDIIPTECGCEKHIQLFKNIGAWIENENRVPKAGDIIFYDWQDNGVGDNTGSSDHVGIVEKVEGNTITVIEGNINNAVGRRNLQVNGRYIRGYGVPKYDTEEVPVTPVAPVNDKKEVIRSLQHAYNVSYNAGLVEDGIKGPKTEAAMRKYPIRNYKANELARWVQDRLVNHKGYGLTIDGKYGKDTERVVKQFQKDNRLSVDGIAGFNTINILI